MNKIKIFIVDDHSVVREGLPQLLEFQPDFEVIGSAETGEKALEKLRFLSPDVLILDISMPGMSGFETIGLLLEILPKTRIVIYSMHEKEAYVHKVLSSGAFGYVLKGAPVAELIGAVRAVCKNEYFLSAKLNSGVIDSYLSRRKEKNDELSRYDLLSEREQQVFRLMVEGKATAQIGHILCVSPKTVEKHRVNIMKKLSLKNPIEMVKYAVRIGLVDPDLWKI
ncbi:MAG TPA: response regulator transcription factor [Deferrimonas sp.]|jgi:DNA-binding NarL/FixJ family response regulator